MFFEAASAAIMLEVSPLLVDLMACTPVDRSCAMAEGHLVCNGTINDQRTFLYLLRPALFVFFAFFLRVSSLGCWHDLQPLIPQYACSSLWHSIFSRDIHTVKCC